MSFIKTSMLSGLSTVAKILSALIIVKIIALEFGPTGVATTGQFVAVISVLAIVAGGGVSMGVIKYVAEYNEQSAMVNLHNFIYNAFLYTILFSCTTAVIGVVFREQLANWIFGLPGYAKYIAIASIVQILTAMNVLLISILNGFKKIKTIVLVNISGAFLATVIAVIAAYLWGLPGILLALICSQPLNLLFTLLFARDEKWLNYISWKPFNKQYFHNLSKYSLMNIVSALAVPMSQIVVRNDIGSLLSWHEVGYWQAVLRISDAYLQFASLVLTMHYLPRLSGLLLATELKKEIISTVKHIVPFVIVTLAGVFIFKTELLRILYTSEFMNASNLFAFQLLGDFFRILGWLFTYLLLAKTYMKTYIFTEIFLSVLFIVISHIFLRKWGLIGVTYSFFITYFIYSIFMFGISMPLLRNINCSRHL